MDHLTERQKEEALEILLDSTRNRMSNVSVHILFGGTSRNFRRITWVGLCVAIEIVTFDLPHLGSSMVHTSYSKKICPIKLEDGE